MRLEKYLSDCGVGTRSQCKTYIRKGMIKVDGKTVCNGSLQVSDKNLVTCCEKPLYLPGNLYFMFHKPAGCICAAKDPVHKTVLSYFPPKLSEKLLIAGRLDKDTEGFLILTDDGAFVHQLMSPKKHVEKTYFFKAHGRLFEDAVQIVASGMDIGDEKPTKPARLEITEYRELTNETEGFLTISEGRYHQVKRMIKVLGGEVFYLKRMIIGNVSLDESLPAGAYRALTKAELEALITETRESRKK